MNVGNAIRKIRKNKGLTMKELGMKIGLSEQGIGNYERGDRKPSIEILKKISNALGVTINELLGVDPSFSKKLVMELESKVELLLGIDDIFTFLSEKLKISYDTLIEVYKNDIDCNLENQLKLFKYLYKIDGKNFMKFCIQNEKYILKNKGLSKIYSEAILNQGDKIIDADKQNNKDLNKINDIFKYYGYTVKRHNIGIQDMIQLLNDKNNIIFDVPFEDFYEYAVKEMLKFIDRSVNSEITRLIEHFK